MMKTPSYYVKVAKRIAERTNTEGIIEKDCVCTIIGRFAHIDSSAQMTFIKELVEYKLMIPVDKEGKDFKPLQWRYFMIKRKGW